LPADAELRIQVRGPSFDDADQIIDKTLLLPLGAEAAGPERLSAIGITVIPDGDTAVLEEPFPGTPFGDLGETFDFYGDNSVVVSSVDMPADRLPKEIFFIPALIVLGLVIAMQRGRREEPVPAMA